MAPCLISLCLQLGFGIAHANPQGDGMFYNAELPYAQHLNALTWSIGFESRQWRFGYENLNHNGTDATVHQDGIANGPRYAMHSDGTTEGIYVERTFHRGAWHAEAGAWIYRASYWLSQPGAPAGTSAHDGGQSRSVGPVVGVGYGPLAWTIRGTPCRAKDVNGNNFPSSINQFAQTVEIRYTF